MSIIWTFFVLYFINLLQHQFVCSFWLISVDLNNFFNLTWFYIFEYGSRCTGYSFQAGRYLICVFSEVSLWLYNYTHLIVVDYKIFLKERRFFIIWKVWVQISFFYRKLIQIKKDESSWKSQWGELPFFSSFSSNSKGVAILIRNNVSVKVLSLFSDPEGRFLILKAVLNKLQMTLVNTVSNGSEYTPHKFVNFLL